LIAIAAALALAACALALVMEPVSSARNGGGSGHANDAGQDGMCPETDACAEPGTTISALAAI